MISLERIITIVGLIWIFIYTLSYGTWTWKKKNKFGAIMVYMIALIALALPIYSMFFREG